MNSRPAPIRISLRDIARKLGISHVTVSLALRNARTISEERRKQVQETAKAMGYRPDPVLSALAHYRESKRALRISSCIAWLNFWPAPEKLRSYREFQAYWTGAQDAAALGGYRLEEFVWNRRHPIRRLEKILNTRNVLGILLPPNPTLPDDFAEFNWQEFSFVRFGYAIKSLQGHVVTSNQVLDALLAFDSIVNAGYARIGFVTSFGRYTRFNIGVLAAQQKLPLPLRLPHLELQHKDAAEDRSLLAAWLKKHRPDAVLTDVADMRQRLDAVGAHVPEDVGLASLSILDCDADAGIQQNSEEIGRAATQLLISLVHNNERGVPKFGRELLVEGNWVDGSTLPRRGLRTEVGRQKSEVSRPNV